MQIIKGDIWSFYYGYNYPFSSKSDINPICITTNGILDKNGHLVMGKGIALEAKTTCPDCPIYFGKMVKWYGNKPFYYEKYNLLSFPTKHHWIDVSYIDLIEQSALIIKELAEFYNFKQVYSPWPGCGNGGLDTSFVKNHLEKIWDSDRFIIVEKEK